jgi:hypothetical protein
MPCCEVQGNKGKLPQQGGKGYLANGDIEEDLELA